MLACLQTSPDPAEVSAFCHEVTDWDAFVGWWLSYHRTLPPVHDCLGRHGWTGVPARVRERLRREDADNARRLMRNAAALIKTCRVLSDGQVPHLAFKGPTLALRVHGDLGRRHAGDLDLLVDPSSIDLADTALRTAGYRLVQPDFQMSPRQKRVYGSIFHHLIYRAPDGEAVIELHWRLTANPYLLPVSFDDLWNRSRNQMMGGHAVPTLSDADMGLHLFAHGANHAWFRLFWLCDIAALTKGPEFDWTAVIDHAADRGLSRPVLQGALLAHRLLGCPVPEAILTRAAREPRTTGLTHLVVERLVTRYDPYHPTVREALRAYLFYLPLLRRDLAYKATTLNMLSLRPEDWRDVTLPDWLFPLYYVLRVPLWCLRKVWRH